VSSLRPEYEAAVLFWDMSYCSLAVSVMLHIILKYILYQSISVETLIRPAACGSSSMRMGCAG
jgi:hypothetical protein